MDLLELKEGAHVRTADGEDLGRIERFIVDPSTSQVTHVVVEKGLFFPNDRLVPVDRIDHVDDEGAVLSEDVAEDTLPPFETAHYVEVDDTTRNRLDNRLGAAAMWRFPVLATGLYPMYPLGPDPLVEGRERAEVRRANIPGSSAVLTEDTAVVGVDGEDLGTVAEMYVDEDGRLSHLVVDLGFLAGRRILPAHWIESLREDQVTVAVGKQALEALETAG